MSMTAAERKKAQIDRIRAEGGSVLNVPLDGRATRILEQLAAEFGSKKAAIEQALINFEQRSLL